MSIKLAIYKDNLSTGRGADHLVCAQAEGLASIGHDVTLVTCVTSDFAFPVADTVKIMMLQRKAVRDAMQNFDVCMAGGSNEILDLTDNGRSAPPIPTVTELLLAPRGFFKRKRIFRNWRIKRAFNRSHILQILCDSYERELRSFAPIPEVVTIAEWADVRDPTGDEISGSHRRKEIIYPAYFNKLKNQMLLIRAFALLADEFPDWTLALYGNSQNAYGAKCVKAASRLAEAGRVRFMPFTDDLPSAYASASIMAFPSTLEGFPLAVIEGMKFALPSVLVDDLPGVRDMVEDGINGIISKNDVMSYSAALRHLMIDEAERHRLGVNAMRICGERYAKESIIRQWDGVIRRLAGQTNSWESRNG